jgi:hypothetical protein
MKSIDKELEMLNAERSKLKQECNEERKLVRASRAFARRFVLFHRGFSAESFNFACQCLLAMTWRLLCVLHLSSLVRCASIGGTSPGATEVFRVDVDSDPRPRPQLDDTGDIL